MNLKLFLGVFYLSLIIYAFYMDWGFVFWGLLLTGPFIGWHFLGGREENAKKPKMPLKPQKPAKKLMNFKNELFRLKAIPEADYKILGETYIFDHSRFASVRMSMLNYDLFKGSPDEVYKALVAKWGLLFEHEFMVAIPTGWSLDIVTTRNPSSPGGAIIRIVRTEGDLWKAYRWEAGKRDVNGDSIFVVADLIKKPKLWFEFLKKQGKTNR